MKAFILSIALLGFFKMSYCQLEVIDKIAGTLIPTITSGIQGILSSAKENRKKKVDSTAISDLQASFQKQIKELKGSVANDKNNIEAINKLFQITGNLLEDISSIETLSYPEFLKEILVTNSDELFKQTCLQFKRHWDFVISKRNSISTELSAGISVDLLEKLNVIKTELDRDISTLQSITGFTKPPNFDDPKSNENLLKVLSQTSASLSINRIKSDIININIILSSRLNNFNESLKLLSDKTTN